MKKIGMLVLTMVLGLSANGVIFAKGGLLVSDLTGETQPCIANDEEKDGLMLSDRTGLMLSDRAGLLISDLAASATGIIIVGRSGLLMSDLTSETPNCPETF